MNEEIKKKLKEFSELHSEKQQLETNTQELERANNELLTEKQQLLKDNKTLVESQNTLHSLAARFFTAIPEELKGEDTPENEETKGSPNHARQVEALTMVAT